MIKRLINKSEFVKNVATLFTGTLIAQSIPILISPVLSRIYDPEDFAVNEIFMRIFSIGIIFSTLRLEQAVVLPKIESKAIVILKLIARISAYTALFFLSINFFFGNYISDWKNINNLELYFYILPFTLFISANYQALTYWTIRNKAFKLLSLSKVGVAITNSSVRVFSGWISNGNPIGLIGSIVIAQFIGLFILVKKSFTKIYRQTTTSKTDYKIVLKEYKDFPRINTWHALLDAAKEAIIIYILISYFGNTTLGLYAFTLRLMKLPLGMIGTSIGQVFFQKASETVNQQKSLHQLTLQTVKKLIYISLPIFIGVAIFSPFVFELIFGEKWAMAGKMAQVFSPWMFFLFLNSPLSQIPLTIKKQKEVFILSIFGFILSTCSLLYAGIYIKNPINGMLLFSLVQSLYLLFVILWTLNITKRFDNRNVTA